MKFAFIDTTLKPGIRQIKPEIFKYDTGNEFYIFPGQCRKKRLDIVLQKYGVTPLPNSCSREFLMRVYCKAIMQALKEYNLDEIVFCFDKYTENLELLTYFFNRDVHFSLALSSDSDSMADFFLEKYGLPVRVVSNVKTGLLVYGGGIIPQYSENILPLDLTGELSCCRLTITEYKLKKNIFPVKINSLSLLETALKLTGMDIKDIIVKLCIIGTNCE